jgi:hypothetical protein
MEKASKGERREGKEEILRRKHERVTKRHRNDHCNVKYSSCLNV